MHEIKIADSIKEKTTQCVRDFACLTGNTSCMCEVMEDTNRCSVKIKPKSVLSCKYYVVPFGTCRCPTRVEIYRKHKM